MKPIDLGKKLSDKIEVHSLEDIKDETHYPTLYLGDIDDPRLLDLPDEGECTIKYKVRSRSHREDKRGDKPKRSCCLDLDVLSIAPPEKKSYGNGAKDSDKGARKAFNDYFGK